MRLPRSSLDEAKHKLLAAPNHRTCVLVGSGEAGYLAYRLLPRLVPRMAGRLAWLTPQPVHRLRLTECLLAVGHCTPLDAERPLLRLNPAGDFVFEEVAAADPARNAHLLQVLKSVLMLLPQGEYFQLLRTRIESAGLPGPAEAGGDAFKYYEELRALHDLRTGRDSKASASTAEGRGDCSPALPL